MAHPIVHVELSTTNPAESGKFYSDLFGWSIVRDESVDYTMWESIEGTGGGFQSVGEHFPAGSTMIYVGTEDIDATLAKAESLGAMVSMPKMQVPGGWIAAFRDPVGNNVGLFSGSHGSSEG